MTEELPGQLSLFKGPYFLVTHKEGVPEPLVLFETWRDTSETDRRPCEECGTYCTSDMDCTLDEREARP